MSYAHHLSVRIIPFTCLEFLLHEWCDNPSLFVLSLRTRNPKNVDDTPAMPCEGILTIVYSEKWQSNLNNEVHRYKIDDQILCLGVGAYQNG